ncbi:MAG TPA: type IV secretory system conjugative DNA transfer family protein [Bryobacteraceae bacterium]|nr:type IV secretory system conjugative DNA transfer family protein [Bryobacteraceae bacterium]
MIVLGGGAVLAFREGGSGTVSPPKPAIPPGQPRPVYGNAEFAQPYGIPTNPRYVYDGVFFGKSSMLGGENVPINHHQGGPVCSTPHTHVLIAAQTGAGKGTRVIIPTLLRWMHNTVVIDPKGENAAVTARARASHPLKQKIHIINPWDELGDVFRNLGFQKATYNPLDIIDPKDKNAVAYAQSLARAICPLDKGDNKANFWNRNAASILTAIFLWLADTPGETKTLARARDIVTETRPELQKYLALMSATESKPFGAAIRENIRPLIGVNNETFMGIITTAAQFTDFLSDPQVKEATAASTFTTQEFMTNLSTIYLIVPTDKMDTQATWLRLMITAIIQAYKHKPHAMQIHPCMFLIDEFPALQRIDAISSDIAMMRGYHVMFTLVVQGLSDLRSVYHDDADRILNNCHYKWFCNVKDLHSAKYLSDSLGTTTVQTVGTGESQSSGGKGGSVGQSINYGQTARPLMMPNEILNLGRETAILLAPSGNPHYLRTVDYWDLAKAFMYLSVVRPQLYHDPPLMWDRNPLLPSSQGSQQGKAQSPPLTEFPQIWD